MSVVVFYFWGYVVASFLMAALQAVLQTPAQYVARMLKSRDNLPSLPFISVKGPGSRSFWASSWYYLTSGLPYTIASILLTPFCAGLSVNLKIALLLASFTVFTIGIVKAMLYAVKTHQEWWLDFVPVNSYFPTVSADEIATIVRNAVNKSFQDSLRGNLLPAPELPDAELEMLPQANCTYPDVCPHKPEGCNGECTYYRPNPD